jgi:hypothetical protein
MGRLSDHERRKSNSDNSVESAISEADMFQYEVEERVQLSWEEPSMPFHPLDGPPRVKRRPSLDSMRVYTGDDIF